MNQHLLASDDIAVGYIGLGAMGGMLARRLLPVADLHVWELDPKLVDGLRHEGAAAMASAAEVARRANIIFLSLPKTANVEQVVFGPKGLIEGMQPGTLLVDQTSGTPAETRAIAARLAQAGVVMMDAPVSGTPAAAAAGECSVLVSGHASALDRAMPLLRAISHKVLHCGSQVGDAQATKLVNNAINTGCRLATLEMAALGTKCGLDLASITDALNSGMGRNRPSQLMLTALVQGRPSTNFALKHVLKDMNQALQMGMERSVPMPISGAARGLVQIGCNLLGATAALEDVVGLVQTLSATRLVTANTDVHLHAGTDRASILRLIDNVVAHCNEWVTLEGLAMGAAQGLRASYLVAAVKASSGWSKVMDQVDFASSESERESESADRLRAAAADLQAATRIAIENDASILVVNEVRSRVEALLDRGVHATSPDP